MVENNSSTLIILIATLPTKASPSHGGRSAGSSLEKIAGLPKGGTFGKSGFFVLNSPRKGISIVIFSLTELRYCRQGRQTFVIFHRTRKCPDLGSKGSSYPFGASLNLISLDLKVSEFNKIGIVRRLSDEYQKRVLRSCDENGEPKGFETS
jgi:hypothetical protein